MSHPGARSAVHRARKALDRWGAARLVDAGYALTVDAVFARASAERAEEMEREALKKRSLPGGTRGWPSGPRWRRPRPSR